MRQRRKKIFRGVALAFAVAAFAVPTAQARHLSKSDTNPTATSAAAGYTQQQFRALELRSRGMNDRYGSATASLTPQQLEQQLRFQGVDKQHGLIGRTTSSVQSSHAPTLVVPSDGFNWGAAFVGAAATFGTAIILVLAFTAARRREQPLGV
jgi:hypothetical protein